jgi:hypothetical protein
VGDGDDQAEAEADVDDAGNGDFTGKTFQEAQQMIVADLIGHVEDGYAEFVMEICRTELTDFTVSRSLHLSLPCQHESSKTTTSSFGTQCP